MLNSVGAVITDTGETQPTVTVSRTTEGRRETLAAQIIDEGLKLLAGLFHDLKSVREGEDAVRPR
jgi:hypothetical protein